MGFHKYSMPASVKIEAVAKAPMLEDDISSMSVGSCHLCNGSSIVDDLRHILIHENIIIKFCFSHTCIPTYVSSIELHPFAFGLGPEKLKNSHKTRRCTIVSNEIACRQES